MISKKILYSEQLLQLVLALSLLQVDPINYLEWGVSRTHHSDDGSPWQLEIAQTPLFSDYPYMNRKTYVPFNEDFGRFSHIHNYGLQTYLLNLSDDPIRSSINGSSNNNNDTRFIESNSNIHSTNGNITISITADIAASLPSTTAATASSIITTTTTTSTTTTSISSANLINLIQESSNSLDDPFLHSDVLFSSDGAESIAEQNLADLHDYEEIVEPLYVPTKSDISNDQDVWLEFRGINHHENHEEEGLATENANRISVIELNLNDTSYTRSAVLNWNDVLPFANDSSAENVRLKITKETDERRQQHANLEKENETNDVGVEDRNNNEPVITSSVELTVEEMDLIEVLWKQDVDLGYNPSISVTQDVSPQKAETIEEDDVEKLKALLELKTNKKSEEKATDNDAPWPNLAYTIDTETGEYIFSPSENNNTELENLLFDDNLQLVDVNDLNDKGKESTESEENSEAKGEEKADDLEAILENNLKLDFESGKEDDFLEDLNSSLSILLDEADNLDILGDMMIQPASTHFQHPRQPQNYAHCVNYRQSGYQGRVPLGRTMSMEQRWQDLANLLSFPPGAMGMADMNPHAAAAHYSHYPYQASGPMTHSQHSQFAHPHSHSVLHNASLAEIASQPTTSHHLQPYSSNLGSAVATSMHLTSNSTSETDAGNSAYKMEHDLMYYSQQAEMNHPSDGILNIFNDEDLQLMDMAVNEGMYTMRMLDQNSNCTNSTSLASNPHFNNTLLGAHMPTNLSSGVASAASTISTQQHAAGDRLDASSDSAVSSMGSERVASLSDGEWNEAGSDSAQEYHSRKLVGPYDYRFNNNRMLDANRQPVAQKKHQMYGKRFAHESTILPPPPSTMNSHTNGSSTDSIPNIPIKYEPYDAYNNGVAQTSTSNAAAATASVIKPPLVDSETKYSYSLDFPHPRHKSTNGLPSHELVHHNHTYTMPPHPNTQQLPNSNGANPKPQMRDKKAKKSEDEHLTRDEKRARSMQIPITVHDIINLPMDEFNERLSKYDLSENQLSLIRDIRRRGKNKVAAQNCRKRKLDQIISLADEVKDMKMRKDRFLREREMLLTERRRIKDKFAALYRHVFTNLRDPDGNPYSSYQYSLQQSADGSVVLVPRSDQNSTENAAANGNGPSQRNSNSQHGSNNNSSNFK